MSSDPENVRAFTERNREGPKHVVGAWISGDIDEDGWRDGQDG